MGVYVGYVVYEMKQQNNMSNLASFLLCEYEKQKNQSYQGSFIYL